MIEITKPLKHLPLFLVVNYKSMLSTAYQSKMNLIVLNSRKVDELKANLSKDLDRSRRFIYWLGFIDQCDTIAEMNKLTVWMIENKINFWIPLEQLEMYCNTLEEAQSKISFPIEKV